MKEGGCGSVLKLLPSGIPFAVLKIRLFYDSFTTFFQASCLGNSVCGFLQANSKGVSKIPYCNCSTVECPLNWDPFDGKSVTQSVSDQYKVYLKKNSSFIFFALFLLFEKNPLHVKHEIISLMTAVLRRVSFRITHLFVGRRGTFIHQCAILRQMDTGENASQRRHSMFVSRKVQLFRHTLQIHGQRTLRYCCYQLLLSTCKHHFKVSFSENL